MEPDPAEVFISYSSRDRERVMALGQHLERAVVRVWHDQAGILGGENYGPKIVDAIRAAKVLIVCCSDAALRSKNVKQEIQLAWGFGVPYLPVLLESVSYPDQVRYWLEGWQRVDILDYSEDRWLPALLRALRALGVGSPAGDTSEAAKRGADDLHTLWSLAAFTDQIWPIAHETTHASSGGTVRDLGAPQDHLQRTFRLGSKVRLVIEADRDGHLLLLDLGTSGLLYCLCPSSFARDQRVRVGLNYLPQSGAAYDSFAVTGRPGREHVLAVISDEPLCADWMVVPGGPPARQLGPSDVRRLIETLRQLDVERWRALATYFEIVE